MMAHLAERKYGLNNGLHHGYIQISKSKQIKNENDHNFKEKHSAISWDLKACDACHPPKHKAPRNLSNDIIGDRRKTKETMENLEKLGGNYTVESQSMPHLGLQTC